MKKIFRMALVFALAGATLMYTGCTKDYSEDINKLDKELQTLEDQYKALSDELSTLKSGVASLEAAYKAADVALDTKFSAKIDEIQKAIDKKADAKEVEDAIDALRKEALESANALEKKLDGKLAEAQKLLDKAIAAFSNELRTLVFVPDFYFAGIEATSYDFAEIKAVASEPIKEAVAVGTMKLLKGAKVDWARVKNAKGEYDKDYVLGQQGVAKYDVNPSSFVADENVSWKFNKKETEYVIKGEEEKEWKPVFEGISYNKEAGYAEANFSIENPELLVATIFGATPNKVAPEIKSNIPAIQLEGSLAEDKTIASDWAVVTTAEEVFSDLAFTKKSKYTTESTQAEGKDCYDPDNENHLYTNVKNALKKDASVEVQYNGGPVDLSKIIAIHVLKDGEPVEMTLEQLQAKYPGFEMNFELVPYSSGAIETNEAAYGQIDGSMFTPCYVDEKGVSHPIAEGSEEGISSVGRMPVVLVTLVEPAGSIILYGNFKIEIVPQAAQKNIKPIDVKDFGTLPFLCNTEVSTVWYEFSAKVLEAMKIDYDQFQKSYQIVTKGETLKPLAQGKTYEAQIYVKGVDGFEIAYKLDKDGKPTDEELKLGTVTYSVDKKGTTVNDKITWSFDKEAAANVAKVNDVYVLFMLNEYTGVAFKLSAAIAAPAEITYGEINPSYWFKDVEPEVQNTVRANVLVPNKTSDDVTKFEKDLDDYFVGNKVKVVLKDESKEVYGEAWKTMTTTYSYKFAAAQPVINGKPFVANESGTELFVAKYDDTKKEYKKDNKGNYIADTDKMIAALATDGVLTYQKNETAKEFLNLWGITETDVEKMLYANVQIDYSAGDCKIAEGSDVFHVRFVRPLTITNGEGGQLKDAEPAGSEIALGYLFNAIDWNGLNEEPLFKWHAKTNTEKYEGFVANTYKGIVWYTYYGISQVFVDCANALTNQTGEWGKLSEINKAAKLALYKGTEPDNDNVAKGIKELDANNVITGLSEFKLHYENNMGETEDFALRIPVEVTYNWGTIKVEVEIPVQGTKNK